MTNENLARTLATNYDHYEQLVVLFCERNNERHEQTKQTYSNRQNEESRC